MRKSLVKLLAALVLSASLPIAKAQSFRVPFSEFKLDNGLRVILTVDTAAPVVAVAVYYDVGSRNETRGRTGFAHLFEHMMFQGSENLGKMAFIRLIESNGGLVNGSTRFDFTNYYQVVPSHVLETVLWAEADRMRGLDIVFCRNVMIYFDRETQHGILQRLGSRLKPEGLLFVGHSESLHGNQQLFKSCGNTVYTLRK